jgi:hypothetical protein
MGSTKNNPGVVIADAQVISLPVVQVHQTEPTMITVQLLPPKIPDPPKEEKKEESSKEKIEWQNKLDIILARPWIKDVCHTCGVMDAYPKEYVLAMLRSQKKSYCPNGHSGTFDDNYLVNIVSKIDPSVDEFVDITCGKCGLTYKLTNEFNESRMQSHEIWWCPNGCQRHYPRPDPPAKTEEQVDYGKMISYHDALGTIALTKPKAFGNKKLLRTIINIARNTLDLSKLKD